MLYFNTNVGATLSTKDRSGQHSLVASANSSSMANSVRRADKQSAILHLHFGAAKVDN